MIRVVGLLRRGFGRSASLGLVGLLALLGPADRVQAAAEAYILTSEEVEATYHRFLDVVNVQLLPHTDAQWESVARYRVTSPGTSPVDLFISASILPSIPDARRFFGETNRVLESNNESTWAEALAPDSALGADEARQYRLIFTGDQSGQRLSDYARLMRFGRAVALVEAVGSPDADDHGHVDNDRGLGLAWIAELVAGKMLYYSAESSPQPLADFSEFSQEWGRHGWSLWLDPTGHGDAHWRVYTWCSENPRPPCDRLVGTSIEAGGLASLIFYGVYGQTAEGVVIGSSDPSALHVGAVSLTLEPNGMARLIQDGRGLLLCGPDFTRLAPASLQASAPCGA